MIFKEMKDTDLVRVLELEQACFKQPWLEKDCLYELNENPFSHGWILEDGDTIVGYAFYGKPLKWHSLLVLEWIQI